MLRFAEGEGKNILIRLEPLVNFSMTNVRDLPAGKRYRTRDKTELYQLFPQ
jgi:hypothetical protein